MLRGTKVFTTGLGYSITGQIWGGAHHELISETERVYFDLFCKDWRKGKLFYVLFDKPSKVFTVDECRKVLKHLKKNEYINGLDLVVHERMDECSCSIYPENNLMILHEVWN